MILQSGQLAHPASPSRPANGGRLARAGALEAQQRLGATLQSALHGETVERLARLRQILPVLGEELATARREAARLRVENRKLAERASKLEHDLAQAVQATCRSIGKA